MNRVSLPQPVRIELAQAGALAGVEDDHRHAT